MSRNSSVSIPGAGPEPQKAVKGEGAVLRSFSLSVRNQGEPGSQGAQEPMRIRSATTSGAPGVEKARNSVRQKASGKHAEKHRRWSHLCVRFLYSSKTFQHRCTRLTIPSSLSNVQASCIKNGLELDCCLCPYMETHCRSQHSNIK